MVIKTIKSVMVKNELPPVNQLSLISFKCTWAYVLQYRNKDTIVDGNDQVIKYTIVCFLPQSVYSRETDKQTVCRCFQFINCLCTFIEARNTFAAKSRLCISSSRPINVKPYLRELLKHTHSIIRKQQPSIRNANKLQKIILSFRYGPMFQV